MEASAPGKVLILGGYLVVEAPNVGVSIGVNARFRTIARRLPQPSVLPPSSSVSSTADTTLVHIHSPQFHQDFDFVCTVAATDSSEGDKSNAGVVTATQTTGPHSPFLLYAVLYAVAAAHMLSSSSSSSSLHSRQGVDDEDSDSGCGSRRTPCSRELSVELLADNDFYSQRNYLEQHGQAVTTATLRALPPHLPLVGAVSKTGLGSSAAMTTSVVACVLAALLRAHDDDKDDASVASWSPPPRELVHRLAQLAHSVAQGKIGSGFDVFTAVYGTCAYRRFSVEHVHALMQHASEDNNKQQQQQEQQRAGGEHKMAGAVARARVVVAQLQHCVDLSRAWVNVEAFALPRGVQLVLGDVHQGGSSTPGMVAKVMQWRRRVADDPASAWEQLRGNNDAYVTQLRHLHTLSERDTAAYDAACRTLQSRSHLDEQHDEDKGDSDDASAGATRDVVAAFVAMARCAARSRALLRGIGVAAGVAIEPPELTQLLDATAALPGVIAVGCPGAGGYDAVFALVLGEACRGRVEAFWSAYAPMAVCPLLVREGTGGLTMTHL